MVAFSKIALVAAAAGSAIAIPLLPNLGPLAVFDTLKAVPKHWTSQGAALGSQLVRAQIGLKQSNIEQLQAKLLDISNPESPNYGHWLSKAELDAFTAPPAENIAAVKAWLATAGITNVEQPSPDWIEFSVPVSKMESLLNAKYTSFYNANEGRDIPRTEQYSVPEALHDIIDMITPTTAFYQKILPKTTEADELALEALSTRASCSTSQLTPACLKSIYNVDYTAKGGSVPIATTELIYVGAVHSDFKTFVNRYAPGTPDFTDVSVSGGSNPGASGSGGIGEGNLDTQWAGALANPIKSQYIALGPENGFADEISNLASYLTSTSNPPSAVSTSYGGEEQGFSSSYLTRVCNEFMKAGSMGISVFFSSGDSGIGGNQEPSCDDGFYVNWPASCPWSTAVGGTQFNGSTETVAIFDFSTGYDGSSGGGFSYAFSAPSYQSSAVSSYKSKLGNQFSGYYNPNGRGFPDVSLVAKNYLIVENGSYYLEGGTSASSPAWAALVATLNDYRKANGKSNLGFINTLVYGSGKSAMRDITSGNNYGCNQDGFPALSGWDPATGLGSLDYGKLRAML